MALLKEVTFENGVKIKYHKIKKIFLEETTTKVSVVCYTDTPFREIEKTNEKNKKEYDLLLSNILEENKKEGNAKDIEQIKEWSEKANILVSKFNDTLDLSVISVDFDFENLTDLSLSSIYKLLKEEELFSNAEDI